MSPRILALAGVLLLAASAHADDTDTDTDIPVDTGDPGDTGPPPDTTGERTAADLADEEGGTDCATLSAGPTGLALLSVLAVAARRRRA
jgi:hypothetical protein